MNVGELINQLESEIGERKGRIEWLIKHREKLEALSDLNPSWCGEGLDFDYLSHENIIRVVRTMAGSKWSKLPASAPQKPAALDYQTKIDGVRVRCYAGDPPPSCKLIEVEEHVPEQIIPASVRKVKKLVCHPELPAVIATAAEKGANETIH